MPWSLARSAFVHRVTSAIDCTPAALSARRDGPDIPGGKADRFGCVTSLSRGMRGVTGLVARTPVQRGCGMSGSRGEPGGLARNVRLTVRTRKRRPPYRYSGWWTVSMNNTDRTRYAARHGRLAFQLQHVDRAPDPLAAALALRRREVDEGVAPVEARFSSNRRATCWRLIPGIKSFGKRLAKPIRMPIFAARLPASESDSGAST